MGTGSRVPLEVESDAYNSGVDEENIYSDVIHNLRRTPRAENQDEADNAVRVNDDVVGEDEDLAAVEWDPLNRHMEEELCGRFEEDTQGTDNQEEKRRSNEHKVHEEQSDGKKLKDQTEAPKLFMRNCETL
ncbi:hypothetical protein ZWY2020_002050 [Hordeum vulgare]|nr:hypothetical protein ZWY2020_002050 [Hordeum vulgare]